MSKEISSTPAHSNSWKETEFPLIKDQIFEQLAILTNTDMRMNETQKSGFMKCYWDLVAQEPSIQEMKDAQQSYIAHFNHIPSPFAFVKHFNRFRSGILPIPKKVAEEQIQKQYSELKMQQWIKEMESKDDN
jgi:hypothetical protein